MRGSRRYLMAAFVLGLLGSCGDKGPEPPDLTQTLLESMRDTGVATFATAFPGEWERVVIVPPYTSENEAKHIVGANWNGYAAAGIATRGDITLLVFLDGKKRVSNGGMVKRYAMDYNAAFRLGGYSRKEARFRVVEKVAVQVPEDPI